MLVAEYIVIEATKDQITKHITAIAWMPNKYQSPPKISENFVFYYHFIKMLPLNNPDLPAVLSNVSGFSAKNPTDNIPTIPPIK